MSERVPRVGLTACFLLCSIPVHAYFATVNSTDHTEIHVVPAPGKVKIDGDLEDWDLSGAILMKLDEASKSVYSVLGAMMYEKDALYVGAHVKDPTPMVNNYSFADDPGMAWNADAIQLRFLSDPAVKSTATLQSGGSGLSAEQAKHVCHITLWYSTRDQKPGFFICYTLAFSDGKLNPPEVTGAYKKDADGKGYVMEYRIPWGILRAPRPLTGGDQVQTQWQLHWGNDQGQGLRCGMTDVRNPASGDLGYMGPGCWGMAIFEKTGNLKIAETTSTGSRPNGHIPIEFVLEKDSKVSLAICDATGKLVRTCLGAEPYKAGKHTYLWDGLDDTDKPLPAGSYTYKLLVHNGIEQKFVCDVGVSGDPPYQIENGTGGWAGDYGVPWYVATEGDSVVLGTGSAEAAPATICTDLEGKRRYGTFALGNALVLKDGYGYFAQRGNGKLIKFDLKNGYLTNFKSGKAEAVIIQKEPNESNEAWGGRSWTLYAMAIAKDTLVISCGAANKLYFMDYAAGTLKGEAELKAPVGLATDPAGTLYAVSENSVGRYDIGNKSFTPIVSNLDSPAHLACDAQGNLYVSLRGKTMQVWKLDKDGKVLQKFGKPGGRPWLGKFDPAGMLNPWAIAVDKNGRLWVCEADGQPKRYSVWNPDGTLYKDFFGSMDYSTTAYVDPEEPDYVYAQSVRYRVDYDKGTWQPDATILRESEDGGVKFGVPGTHPGAVFVNYKGRKFLFVGSQGLGIYELVGERFTPRLWAFRDEKGANKLWIDTNNDGRVQAEEVQPAARSWVYYWTPVVDQNMNLYSFDGVQWHCQGGAKTVQPYSIVRWEFQGFNDKGGLTYGDPAKPTIVATDPDGGAVGGVLTDDDGSNVYVLVSGGSLERGVRAQGSGHRVVKFSRDGKKLWEYQNVHCAFAWTSEPYFPGYLVGACVFSRGTSRDLVAVTGYYGQYFLLDKHDGLFVDALGDDQRSAYTLDQRIVLTENFNGTLYTHPRNKKTYFIGGDCDARIWELVGLDSVKKSSGTVKVTRSMAKKSEENARLALAAELSKTGKKITVKRLQNAAADGKYDEWVSAKTMMIHMEAERSATAQLGYDAKNLYARFQVVDDSPLINTPTDYKLLFKTGDAVEIQLGTDQTQRQKPTVGDLRLVISRTPEGKMVATVYRPKIPAGEKQNPAHYETASSGAEDYEDVSPWNDIPMHCSADKDSYVVEVAVPWERLGIAPKAGSILLGDVGVIYGNKGGTRNAIRYMWADKSPEISINNDIPSEVRLHPNQWGKLILE